MQSFVQPMYINCFSENNSLFMGCGKKGNCCYDLYLLYTIFVTFEIMGCLDQLGTLIEFNKIYSRLVGKPTMWFPNRSDTNQVVQSQKQARSLKFWS